MRNITRLLAAFAVAVLAAGPAYAAPLALTEQPAVSAPAAPSSPLEPLAKLLPYGLVAFGAIRMKSAAELAGKYKTRAGAAAKDYTDGVSQAGGDWETNTANSEQNYEQGVQQAVARKAFGKGVRNSGAAHYVKRAVELGGTRYQPGVNAGADRWASNTAPYLQAIAGMNLPPKGPRRSPQNQQRANAVAQMLGAMKESRA